MSMIPSPPAEETVTRPRWSRMLLGGSLVAVIVLFYVLGWHRYFTWDHVHSRLDLWVQQVQQHLLPAILLFVLLYVAVTALSLPAATMLSLVAGALFGRWLGSVLVSVSSTCGATLAFLGSRYLFRDWIVHRFGARLEPIQRGVEQDGAFYLFTLRLVPLVPFFLINLGMGLTRMPVLVFAGVSWLGMLLGTVLVVNAGTTLATVDEPGDVLSLPVVVSLGLLGCVPLLLRKLHQWEVKWSTVAVVLSLVIIGVGLAVGLYTLNRYQTSDAMTVPLREFSNSDYPEDPAHRSIHHGRYNGRKVTITRSEDTAFDFVVSSDRDHVADISLSDVDLGVLLPTLPEWTREDLGLQRIALTEQQWNRRQVGFEVSGSSKVRIEGGDGFERDHLHSVALVNTGLNAGLWELLLYTQQNGEKALYYQGWFTLPIGYYREVFESNNGLDYRRHWYYLEHWFDPAGTTVRLDGLRTVEAERDVPAVFDKNEPILTAGEQARKRRLVLTDNLRTWGDFYDGRKVRFASLVSPGRYDVRKPWKNEYLRMERFDKAVARKIVSPAQEGSLFELELVFSSSRLPGKYRVLIGGWDFQDLPRTSVSQYSAGLCRPFGIGVPAFEESYDDVKRFPPQRSAFFALMLDEHDRWINHRQAAVDGVILHRDEKSDDLLHIFLLGYERQSAIAHVVVDVSERR